MLMSWRRKEPGHQQPWYWPSLTEITRSPHVKGFNQFVIIYRKGCLVDAFDHYKYDYRQPSGYMAVAVSLASDFVEIGPTIQCNFLSMFYFSINPVKNESWVIWAKLSIVVISQQHILRYIAAEIVTSKTDFPSGCTNNYVTTVL